MVDILERDTPPHPSPAHQTLNPTPTHQEEETKVSVKIHFRT